MFSQLAAAPSHTPEAALWAHTSGPANPAAREELIMRHLPLVHSIVGRLGLAGCAERDDLVSQGMLGLIHAVDHFDAARGAQFTTFAARHIQGRVLDGLRGLDELSRTTRRRVRQLDRAALQLHASLGRAPADDELAARAGLSLLAARQARAEAGRVTFSLDTAAGPDGDLHDTVASDEADPLETLLDADQHGQLRHALASLPARQQEILALRYTDGLTLKQIAARLRLTEARVSQLHSRAVLSLRVLLEQNDRPASVN
jgi:RNA polymerase sigma factor for flagellar operon FliA